MLDIGKKIKSLRQQKGWSQAEIANLLDISIPAFSKIESDITDLNISRLKQIADTFGVHISEFLRDEKVRDGAYVDELENAKTAILTQAAKISRLQEYIITLYEELHKVKQNVVNS